MMEAEVLATKSLAEATSGEAAIAAVAQPLEDGVPSTTTARSAVGTRRRTGTAAPADRPRSGGANKERRLRHNHRSPRHDAQQQPSCGRRAAARTRTAFTLFVCRLPTLPRGRRLSPCRFAHARAALLCARRPVAVS